MNVRHYLLNATIEQPRDQSFSRLRGISLPLMLHPHNPPQVGNHAPIDGDNRGLHSAHCPGVFTAANDPVEPTFCSIGGHAARPTLIPPAQILEGRGFTAREVVETLIGENGNKLICVVRD